MKKEYLAPEIEFLLLATDIITTSDEAANAYNEADQWEGPTISAKK